MSSRERVSDYLIPLPMRRRRVPIPPYWEVASYFFLFSLFFSFFYFHFFLFLFVYFSIPRAVSASSRSLFARSSARGKVSIAHTRNSRPRSHSPSRTPLVTPIDTCKQTIVKNRASLNPGLFSISAPTTRLLLPVTSLRFCDLHPHPL